MTRDIRLSLCLRSAKLYVLESPSLNIFVQSMARDSTQRIQHNNGAANMETTCRPAAGLPGPRSAAMGRSLDYEPATPSAVSWSAIVAGAAAAALSLILLVPDTGPGFSSVSPWASAGVSATSIGIAAMIWATITQLLPSGLGGFIAGRLRTQ